MGWARSNLQEEPRLLRLAIDNMPRLPVDDIDVLVRSFTRPPTTNARAAVGQRLERLRTSMLR